jgi:hypothetical protein
MKKKHLYTLLIILIADASFYILVLKKQLIQFEWWQLTLYLLTMLFLIFYLIRKKVEAS